MIQQYYTSVPWNLHLRNVTTDADQLITLAELAMSAPLPTDANKFQTNCILNQLGGGLYQNTGSVASPSFTPLSGNAMVNGVVFNFPVFTGSGLNDIHLVSAFTGNVGTTYTITIDSVGATDTFSWVCSSGGSGTMVPMTGGRQILNNGVAVAFEMTTGHTLNDQWVYTAIPVTMETLLGNYTQGSDEFTGIGSVYFDTTNSLTAFQIFGNTNNTPIAAAWGLSGMGNGKNANINAITDGTDMGLSLSAGNNTGSADIQINSKNGGIIKFNFNGGGNYTFPQTNSVGQLRNDGFGNLSWFNGGATTPSLPLTSVQTNNGGSFGGSSNFTFDQSSKNLFVGNNAGGAYLSIQNSGGSDEITFQGKLFAIEQEGTGNIAFDVVMGSNPEVIIGANGWGNNTLLTLKDSTQKFEMSGFGNITSDRIFSFDNINRRAQIGDVDNDFSGTFVDVDDVNQILQISGFHLRFPRQQVFANNAGAIGGGLSTGDAYFVNDAVTGSYQIQVVQ